MKSTKKGLSTIELIGDFISKIEDGKKVRKKILKNLLNETTASSKTNTRKTK